MPFATFTRVREVSSEDNVHVAENLIRSEPGKKWRTRNIGEKLAYVILEMSDCQQISGIDIGNEHSAFVEVLVGKSSCAPEEFSEILITCSFMTPTESKSSNNANRVRCFNQEALVPTASNNKWSLVKVVCTQPFNKHVAYGLSFIKVHVTSNQKTKPDITLKNLVPEQYLNRTLGSAQLRSEEKNTPGISKLKFREESPDSENDSSSSLFNRWKKCKDIEDGLTAAASIRLASKSPVTTIHQRVNKLQKQHNSKLEITDSNILDRNRDKLLFGEDIDEEKYENQAEIEQLAKKIEVDKERRRSELEKETNKNKRKLHSTGLVEKLQCMPAKTTKPTSKMSNDGINKMDKTLNLEEKQQTTPLERSNKKIKVSIDTKRFRPFNQLLSGVVLVISGIQNPDRGILRDKALALGAKYKGDWDNTCTHLICAFKNTPKYNQVNGKGKIVTRSWIEKCYSSKKYLPWRRFALDSNELLKPESDEEIFEETIQNQTDDRNDSASLLLRKTRVESEDRNITLALYDIDDERTNKENNYPEQSSESDTDDEIKRIKRLKAITSDATDIYEASTDEEEYLKQKLNQEISINHH